MMKTATIRWILGAMIVFGYFGTLHSLMINGIPSVNSEPIWILIGGLSAAFGALVQFYFGSSSGSTAKTAMLERMGNSGPEKLPDKGPQPPPATPVAPA